MIHYLGTEVEVVDEKTRVSKNKKKSWEYGYDHEIDVVIISKDGTLGKIFLVNDIKIGLPQEPKKKTIRNAHYLDEYQKWVREELPAGLNEDNWNTREYIDFCDNQAYYREHGYWAYINGKPIYMTGTYWFFLQWVRIEEEYPNFRQIQNEYMIFWEACKADHRSLGVIYGKNRRMGATSMGVGELLSSGITFSDKLLAVISKTGGDSKEVFERLVVAFKRLPPFFKPRTDGQTTPKTELVFREQSKKRKKGEKIQEDEGLNTVIKWYNTTLNGVDGKRVFRGLFDESGKYGKEVPFNKFWSVNKTSFVKGRILFGKAMVVSTVNPMLDGGAEFKEVYYESKTRDKNDRTISGLYALYIPAQYCMEGYFDEYGFSIVDDPIKPVKSDAGDYVKEGANTYLANIEESLKEKPDKLNEQLRQFPRKESDMFRDSNTDCFFNVMKLEEQISYNTEELDDDKYGNKEVIRGNFAWANGVKDTRVIWHPDNENGRFWVAKGCIPAPEYQNQKHTTTKHGITAFAPGNEALGCIGVDPFNREKTSDGSGSDGAMHLYTRMNTLGLPNNTFIMEYIARPKKIEMFFEDVIMAMHFFSVPILPELSSERFSHFLIERGYRHFVKNNPFKKWNELSPEERKCGGINAQNAKFREEQYQALNSHIEDYIGVAREKQNRPIGEMGYMPFTRTLEQWKRANPDKRTDWDAYISSSLAILGCQSRVKIEIEERKPIKVPFKQFDNTGSISKAI